MIHIRLNGEPHSFSEAISLADLLQQLQLLPKNVAVAQNLEVILRSKLKETLLCDGDEIEIFHAVGGG